MEALTVANYQKLVCYTKDQLRDICRSIE